MTEDDLDEVLVIENASFPSPWSRTLFVSELNSPHSFPMVAVDSGEAVVGFICPMLVVDEGHILDVAVAPVFREMGVGRLLVEKVLDECRMQGAEFVSLEVRVSNLKAISLYRQLGFIITGRRKRYYENGEDALLMEYVFSKDKGFDDAV
ncbi:MAG TPA: ribosomal protein S18-alanine N-acetyltransferase [Geobacteraceae bacterium]|nr:ribosomal protein S18-alanine N-acetyltransferase [Geobacteraceae bacterium]